MADVAASVLARLKNKGKESGRSYQLCLQLFCQEEFLRRLEKSKYAENIKTDDYSTVLRTIKDFLTKPIVAAINVTCFNEQWSAATNTWGQGGKYEG